MLVELDWAVAVGGTTGGIGGKAEVEGVLIVAIGPGEDVVVVAIAPGEGVGITGAGIGVPRRGW